MYIYICIYTCITIVIFYNYVIIWCNYNVIYIYIYHVCLPSTVPSHGDQPLWGGNR